MRDRESRDIAAAAHYAQEDAWDDRERPTREEVADLEPPKPFAPHPREVKINGWTYVPPQE
jgi:hypothetical protein